MFCSTKIAGNQRNFSDIMSCVPYESLDELSITESPSGSTASSEESAPQFVLLNAGSPSESTAASSARSTAASSTESQLPESFVAIQIDRRIPSGIRTDISDAEEKECLKELRNSDELCKAKKPNLPVNIEEAIKEVYGFFQYARPLDQKHNFPKITKKYAKYVIEMIDDYSRAQINNRWITQEQLDEELKKYLYQHNMIELLNLI
jgi:hypothetical protein